ncbi:hypothetical protein BaRGS_00020651 [Batillaria attramentaria]|uniref:Secreted protein n=1 Tax=Batillaria attramentaria TaxID=370345 RepID=A0ABD0KM35_9CAEN
MLRCPLLILLLSLVAIDTAWSKGKKDVMNKKQLTAAVKNIQTQMESRVTPVYLDNGYLLAFRVTPGIGVSVFDTYMRTGYDDDNYVARLTMPCGCTSVDGSQPCDRHYRGKVLDTWSNIDRVRVSLYEGGEEKAFVEFDGNDSSLDNWFRRDRLVDSSWPDLSTESQNYFSIAGHARADLGRRFFINKSYAGCPYDFGWLALIDVNDVCDWGKTSSTPKILYSPGSSYVHWGKGAEAVADVMTISVKLRGIDDGCAAQVMPQC